MASSIPSCPLGFRDLVRLSTMKRSVLGEGGDGKSKKRKVEAGFENLDENILFEVLKHADAKTVAMAAGVNKMWRRTAMDERLWELICTRHSANIGCGNQQLRSVVLALGGFHRLHSLYLWHLSKPQTSSPSPSHWVPFSPPIVGPKPAVQWGRDEVHLSLSLLSIRYYEMMNLSNRRR